MAKGDPTDKFATHEYVDEALAAQWGGVRKLFDRVTEMLEKEFATRRKAEDSDVPSPPPPAAPAPIPPNDYKQHLIQALGQVIAAFEIKANGAFIVTHLEIERVGRNIHIEPTIVLR